jgi:DNA-binding SARP family transcriptional activator
MTGPTAPAVQRVQVSLLNGFGLWCGRRAVRLPLSAQRLLAFVALHERPLQRTYVAGQMWTDFSQEHANACLRTTLWRLRRPGCVVVAADSGDIALADEVVVDVREVAERAHRVLEHRTHGDDLARLSAAGELLPDWYDDWLTIERERLRLLRLHALEALCEDHTAAGRYAAAVEAGLAAVAAEPLRETAHRLLIKAHLAEGNACEALRQYGLFRDMLAADLALEPSPAMTGLVADLVDRVG